MKVSILAIGEQKSGPEQVLIDDYCRRFGRIAKNLGMSGIDQMILKSGGGRDREGDALLGKAPKDGVLVRLDEHGKQVSSIEFANQLSTWRDDGQSSLTFMIGGAEGYSSAVASAHPRSLALGLQTWPHMLVRVMISEQIYRAATILAGTPYHKA
ncbi:MAG: 23S rRNA (pseudouridine(1915)-N(3))-methyltransferase RlmH [Pseudomonadota bacterium]